MDDETDKQEMPGQANHFHEDAFVHGVASGLQDKYGISDHVYSLLVYGVEVPVNADGELAQNNDAEAIFAIMPPVMPGGVPSPMTVPMLDGDDEYIIDAEKENLQDGDIVAYYDGEAEQTRTGMYVESDGGPEHDLDDDEVVLVVGSEDSLEDVVVQTGGETNEVEINGETLSGSWSMANDDDEHEKNWWRIAEIEDEIESN
jgi:hypothetical protein